MKGMIFLKTIVFGVQHLLTMFSATVLVPVLLGIPISVSLFTSGLGTLIFHIITKRKVPIYLGSSFAFIAPFIAVSSYYAGQENALAYATGGVVMAGLVYLLFSFIIYKIGYDKIRKLFPSYITGTVILLIGLILASTAVSMASDCWWLSIVTLTSILMIRIYGKGMVAQLPIFIGLSIGYILAFIFGKVDLSFTGFIDLPEFFLPKFSLYAFSIMVPAAIAPALEHIGDIFAVSNVVGKDFTKEPGLHKTLLGDGIATSVAGLFGGAANTTYSENTGVLAITKVFNPLIMEVAAVMAIILSFFTPITNIIMSIPKSVMGGACLVLFGMISTTGLQTIFKDSKELNVKQILITSVMLIISVGGAQITLGNFSLQGIGLAALVGIILNSILIYKEKNLG
jgi:uracil permease